MKQLITSIFILILSFLVISVNSFSLSNATESPEAKESPEFDRAKVSLGDFRFLLELKLIEILTEFKEPFENYTVILIKPSIEKTKDNKSVVKYTESYTLTKEEIKDKFIETILSKIQFGAGLSSRVFASIDFEKPGQGKIRLPIEYYDDRPTNKIEFSIRELLPH